MKCPRCVAFDVDAYEPNEDSFVRLSAAPLPGDYLTTSLWVKKDDAGRKRKRNADGTLDESAAISAGKLPTPRTGDVSPDLKQLRKDAAKARKAAALTDRGSKKVVADKLAKKKVSKTADVSNDQRKVTKPAAAAKINKAEKPKGSSASDAVAMSGESPRRGAYRPQYDSVFSR